MRALVLGAAAALLAGSAMAEEKQEPAAEPVYQPGSPGKAAVGLTESRLAPADHTSDVPPHWTGDISPTPVDAWVAERHELHRHFLQPLVFPSVFPEASVRVTTVAGWHRAVSSADLDQVALLSLYCLDLYVPLITLRDAEGISAGSFRVNLKAGWLEGRHHAVSVFLGGDIPVQGRWVDGGGVNMMVGYAFGSRLFSAQARAGAGIDRLLANAVGGVQPGVLYDAAAGFRPVRPLQLIVQVDGRRVIGSTLADVRLWPALRIFPVDDATFSLGLGGLFWFQRAGDRWDTHRSGGLVDLSWAFL